MVAQGYIRRREVSSPPTSKNVKSRYTKMKSGPLDRGDFGSLIWRSEISTFQESGVSVI
jgi:hypothetical protein